MFFQQRKEAESRPVMKPEDEGKTFGQGEFYYDVKHGRGKLTFPDGKIYEGAFEKDEINGYGTAYFPSGKKYEGLFKSGKANGLGIHESQSRLWENQVGRSLAFCSSFSSESKLSNSGTSGPLGMDVGS